VHLTVTLMNEYGHHFALTSEIRDRRTSSAEKIFGPPNKNLILQTHKGRIPQHKKSQKTIQAERGCITTSHKIC
jgi:hypothetical protein